jgi:hypothetical protein
MSTTKPFEPTAEFDIERMLTGVSDDNRAGKDERGCSSCTNSAAQARVARIGTIAGQRIRDGEGTRRSGPSCTVGSDQSRMAGAWTIPTLYPPASGALWR